MHNTEENEQILTLLKKRRSGFWRFLFSRLLLVMLLIVFQILIFATVYGLMREYFPHFTAIQTVFSIGMVLYLFNCGMESSAKLTWLALIMLFPVPGTILLLYTRVDFGHRALMKRIAALIDETREKLPQNPKTIANPLLRTSGTRDLCKYLNRSGCFPVYEHTAVTYFPLGEHKFETLLTELQKAQKFIYLEYFILAEGYMWGRILAVLAEKAKQGVDVRVLYDGMCDVSTLSFDYPKRMAELGIRCKAFAPITPFLSTHYNYRDHRKILIIDGKTAFNGGINLADEYINRKPRFGHWKDTAVMLKGEAVRSFTLMFLQMWNITEQKPDWKPCETVPIQTEQYVDGFVMPFADCPLDEDKVGETVYMDILNRATGYVHIMTPYLILDGELETAIKFAAQRGVDVKLILPGVPDKKTAYALAKTHYPALLQAGVKIYEYTPGFVHAKLCVSDDRKAVIGTINLDYRSLYHHFECATYLYRTACIPEIELDFQNTLAQCRQITPENLRQATAGYRLLGSFLKIFAPLL